MTGSKPILLALRLQSHSQFYHFSQSETTFINGRKERNEITKLYHVAMKWLPDNLYSIYLETFDREHRSSELSTSEKEFIARMEYMTNEISVISNHFCEIKEIENTQQIEDKTKQQILRLSKEYVGRNAENTFIILKKKARTQSLLITDLCKYNNWGLIFNACYGKYNPNERKSRMRPVPYLIKQMSLDIKEERWVNEGNEEQIIVNIIGSLDETIAVNEIKSKLLDRGVLLKETDQPNLKKYNGSFYFYRKTGQMIGAELRVDFECGNNYIKQVSYSLNAVNYEDIK